MADFFDIRIPDNDRHQAAWIDGWNQSDPIDNRRREAGASRVGDETQMLSGQGMEEREPTTPHIGADNHRIVERESRSDTLELARTRSGAPVGEGKRSVASIAKDPP